MSTLIQRGRQFHEDRITWLEVPGAVFACGTPVDTEIKHRLLDQSRQRLSGPECLLGWDAPDE